MCEAKVEGPLQGDDVTATGDLRTVVKCVDHGWGFFYLLKVDHGGAEIASHNDAMEPEDANFARDLSWVEPLLHEVYALGLQSATARIEELEAKHDCLMRRLELDEDYDDPCCPSCSGTGIAGHPDSGYTCSRCEGRGGPQYDALDASRAECKRLRGLLRHHCIMQSVDGQLRKCMVCGKGARPGHPIAHADDCPMREPRP